MRPRETHTPADNGTRPRDGLIVGPLVQNTSAILPTAFAGKFVGGSWLEGV